MRDIFEMKYDDLKGLQGLRVKALQKMQSPEQVLMFGVEEKIPINFSNMDDLVQKQLVPNDHIFVEIESQDLWIKVLLKMNSAGDINRSFESEFEIKIEKKMTGKDLKSVI